MLLFSNINRQTCQLLNQTTPKFLYSIAHFFSYFKALITGNLDDFTVRLLAKLRSFSCQIKVTITGYTILLNNKI
jgi:hypothetical protein